MGEGIMLGVAGSADGAADFVTFPSFKIMEIAQEFANGK